MTGGAQPLAVTMNEGIALCVEVDETRIKRRLETRYVDVQAKDLDHASALAEDARRTGKALSIAIFLGNAADVLPELAKRGFKPGWSPIKLLLTIH